MVSEARERLEREDGFVVEKAPFLFRKRAQSALTDSRRPILKKSRLARVKTSDYCPSKTQSERGERER